MNKTSIFRNLTLIALVAAMVATPLLAQEQTGELRGQVVLEDGAPVPGALVSASSPAVQGVRTTTTNESGRWVLRNIPPGDYTVTFELEGMATVQASATVQLGQTTPVNVTMGVEAQAETIVVSGELPSVLASSEVSTTYNFQEVNRLPIGNTPSAIATLSPGLTTNTPNGGQVTISGAFAYDNVFLIDGVDANDNLFGTSNPVYIEDAIADVQVLTSGITAEYGRFTGGVVNVITKSGGNEFSGTLRASLTNEDWANETPFQEERDIELVDNVNETYSATLGGYVLKDKIWFFTAGRDEELSDSVTLSQTGIQAPTGTEEERFEIKGTFNIADKHQLQGTFTDREQTGVRPSFTFSTTPDTIRTRTDPSDLKVARYSGVLTPSLFAELQVSEKTFQFNNTHGLDASTVPGTDSFIENSPFFDFFAGFFGHYNAPYFDGKDPEDRNNEQISASTSWFLDTAAAGGHDIKVGFEDFSSFRTGGNSQSPTDWVMTAPVIEDAAGNPVVNPDNTLTPVWIPFATGAWQFLPNRDAEIELNTQSLYVNDRWQLNDNWSFNVGFRYEEVEGESDSGITTVDTDALVPRLAASYDVRGDGKYRFDLTFSQYAGKYSESQFAANTDVGNPPGLLYLYVGAPGTGYNFAPAYDFNNDLGFNYLVVSASDGTQNVLVDDDINSPIVDEITFSFGMELARGGFVKAIYTDRSYDDFVEDFVCVNPALADCARNTGTTDVVVQGVSAGTFSNTFYTNSDLPEREYEALQLIGRYRLSDNWTLDGNWTHQFTNDGNFEGEGTNTPGVSSVIGNYPEVRNSDLHSPVGPLNDFAEDKVRVWTNYNVDFGRAGNVNLGLLANWDSGRVFSTFYEIGLTSTQSQIFNAVYGQDRDDSITSQTIYPNGRGDLEFDDALTFDLSVNYQVPIVRDFQLWLKADVFNVFDDDSQIAGRTEVDANFNGPTDALGIPLTFTAPGNYLDHSGNGSYVNPFSYRFTVGFRF